MILQGTAVNVAAIAAGSVVGRLLGRFIPERMRHTVISGLGLVTVLIGLQLAFSTRRPLILIGSIVLGGVLGELLGIEDRLEALGQVLQSRFSSAGKVAEGFVAASLLYCVGAMAIMGSLQDGLGGKPTILYAKSALDGVASIALASTLGIGVIFSAGTVLAYQGAITLAAAWVQGYLTEAVVAEMNAVGGLLIVAIGLGILQIRRLPVGNLLPGIFVAMALAILFP